MKASLQPHHFSSEGIVQKSGEAETAIRLRNRSDGIARAIKKVRLNPHTELHLIEREVALLAFDHVVKVAHYL